MTSEAETKFMKEFGPRRDAMLGRLAEAAGVTQPKPMSLGDLEVLAAASMELLTTALANIPEPRRGELVNGLSATMAADVARKREWLEQRIPGRRLSVSEFVSYPIPLAMALKHAAGTFGSVTRILAGAMSCLPDGPAFL
jgi:hypothetical protein